MSGVDRTHVRRDRHLSRILTVLVIVLVRQPVHGSEERVIFDRISSQHGLSGERVRAIAQDRQGFMWFATLNGLNRYDGYDFKVFRHAADDPGSVSDNQVRALFVDRDGVLWLGTWGGGLNRYDAVTERFHHYAYDADDPESLSDNQVRAIFEDATGTLWVGTASGLNALDRETGRFTRYTNDPDDPHSLSHNTVADITMDAAGALWIATKAGLDKLPRREQDESPPRFVHYRHNPHDPNSLSHEETQSVFVDRNGDVWVGTQVGGLNKLDPQTGRFTRYQHDPADPGSIGFGQVFFVLEDTQSWLWVGTVSGLDRLDRKTGQFTHYRHDAADSGSLGHNHTMSGFEDRTGALWFASHGGGVSVFDRHKRQFTHYRNDPTDPSRRDRNEIRGMHYDEDGSLWFGAFGDGLVKFDRDGNTFTHYPVEPANPNSLPNEIWTIHGDPDGVLWIGTQSGLSKFVPTTGIFENFRSDPDNPSSLSSSFVASLYRDRSGVLWVGTSLGLNRFHEDTGHFERYFHDPSDPDSLSEDTIMQVLEDRAGTLWIATWGGGLDRLDRETKTFTHIRHDPDDPKSLSQDAVFSLHEGENGVFWVGTSDGLNRMIKGEGTEDPVFVHYNENDGLPNSTIFGILEDDDGNLWLSTNHGLSRFDPRAETFQNYDVTDGLQGNTFSQLDSFHKSSSGEMFFGGINGFNAFYPGDIEVNHRTSPVVFTDFQLARRSVPIGPDSVLRQSIALTESLTLSHEDRIVSFAFATLDFRAPTKNRYRYKLEGLEDAWTEVGSDDRSATYTNLAPGDYTFRVLGSNNHGVWNERGASLHITVTPPWWQTWWFRSMSVVGLMVALFSVHKLRIRFVERRNLELEAEVSERRNVEAALLSSEASLRDVAGRLIQAQEDERKRIALELHDDLNQEIAAFAIELSRLDGDSPDAGPLAHEHLVELENRAGRLSQKVRQLSHRLHPSTIEHVGLVAGLRSLCAEFEKEKGITIEVSVPEHVQPPAAAVLALYRITQEALQNVRKHSRASSVRVSLTASRDALELVVSDNGIGFDPANIGSGAGLGMVSMKERVRLLNGTVDVQSSPGAGTAVKVSLPVGPAP